MKKLLTNVWAKFMVGVLATLFFAISAVCGAGTVYMVGRGFYQYSPNELQEQWLEKQAEGYGYNIYGLYQSDYEQPWCEDIEYFRYRLVDASGKVLASNYRGDKDGSLFITQSYDEKNEALGVYVAGAKPDGAPFAAAAESGKQWYESRMGAVMYAREAAYGEWEWYYTVPACTVEVYMDQTAAVKHFADVLRPQQKLYSLRGGLPASFVGGLLLTAACLVFLYTAAGRKKDDGEIQTGVLEQIPFDVLTAMVCLAVGFLLCRAIETGDGLSEIGRAVFGAVIFLGCWFVGLSYTLTIAVRVKRRELLSGWLSLRLLGWCVRGVRRGARLLGVLFRGFPLFARALGFYAALAALEAVCIFLFWYAQELCFGFWVLEKILLAVLLAYLVLVLQKLQKGGHAIASGNINYHVDTTYMLWDFREFGQCLNHIRDGLGRAVDDRVKSERFKTELITNVSHDIKTPLTSIISYVDLIKKEELPTETLQEYVDVLDRQSQRLKKLIEDLVEASKASTGNLRVQLAECDVQVLLNQSMAEYQEKLDEAGLTPVVKQPKEPVLIRADGRHLWRIFDNLLNNICKYAMPGTRVYLDVSCMDGEARITFRNVSESPLQLDGETLLERFVRGDASRHTEGSGLGLSIAASLAGLQHGRLELVVDGDLFKAVLIFPEASPAAER